MSYQIVKKIIHCIEREYHLLDNFVKKLEEIRLIIFTRLIKLAEIELKLRLPETDHLSKRRI